MHLPSIRTKYSSTSDLSIIQQYLVERKWIQSQRQVVQVERPGVGNMNLVLRVILDDQSSLVIKQSRPWVEKFPELEAPIERIFVENQFYQYTSKFTPIAKYMPSIIGFDQKNAVLLMEDLRLSKDIAHIYGKQSYLEAYQLKNILDYLNCLRKVSAPDFPKNLALRTLNRQHIFVLPFSSNSFQLNNIQNGLGNLARRCQQDWKLISMIEDLGIQYLEGGTFLQHGDFYPGSMLDTPTGLKVIDPEFSFLGPEEWDLAIFTAHLILSRTPFDLITASFGMAEKSTGFDSGIFAGFVGTEILRRLIGLAQLPLELTIEEKEHLIDDAIHWIKSGKIHTLSCHENLELTI